MIGKDGKSPQLQVPYSALSHCCNGGKGFNGCPSGDDGTDGGSVGNATGQNAATPIPLVLNGINLANSGGGPKVVTASFVPGDGGDGSSAFGLAGKQGKDDAGNLLGQPAIEGNPCTVMGGGTYTIIELPGARVLNENGDAAGVDWPLVPIYLPSPVIPTTPHGTQFTVATTLPKAHDWFSGLPQRMNRNGQVVGFDSGGNGGNGGGTWLWSPDQPNATSGTVSNLKLFLPRTINDDGVIAGQTMAAAAYMRDSKVTLLNQALHAASTVLGINTAGKMLCFDDAGNNNLYITSPYAAINPQTDLLTPLTGGGFFNSIVQSGHCINDAGHAVAACTYDNGGSNAGTHAVLWTSKQPTDLGSLGGDSFAGALNNADVVVGYSLLSDQKTPRAFIYQNGHMLDLNTLLPAASNWVLTQATDINDYGEIVGTGSHNGTPMAFLMIPPSGRASVSPRSPAILPQRKGATARK